MSDITQKNLEAALLDQNVAGTFGNKAYAYIAVPAEEGGWQLGIAVANERGYNPIAKIFEDETEVRAWADGLNEHIGRDTEEVAAITISTMGGRPFVAVSVNA